MNLAWALLTEYPFFGSPTYVLKMLMDVWPAINKDTTVHIVEDDGAVFSGKYHFEVVFSRSKYAHTDLPAIDTVSFEQAPLIMFPDFPSIKFGYLSVHNRLVIVKVKR